MSRMRMSWYQVDGKAVYVYTTWVKPFMFRVKVILEDKGKDPGPCGKPFMEYVETRFDSKDNVADAAIKKVIEKLKEDKIV